jgi:hypothetical protein
VGKETNRHPEVAARIDSNSVAPASDNQGRRWMLDQAIEWSGLPPMTRHVLHTLLRRADAQTGLIPDEHQPSYVRLRSVTGLGQGALAGALRDAEKNGWLWRRRGGGRGGQKTRYVVKLPRETVDDDDNNVDVHTVHINDSRNVDKEYVHIKPDSGQGVRPQSQQCGPSPHVHNDRPQPALRSSQGQGHREREPGFARTPYASNQDGPPAQQTGGQVLHGDQPDRSVGDDDEHELATVTDINAHREPPGLFWFDAEHDDRGSPWWGLTVGERYDDTFGTYTESRCSA